MTKVLDSLQSAPTYTWAVANKPKLSDDRRLSPVKDAEIGLTCVPLHIRMNKSAFNLEKILIKSN